MRGESPLAIGGDRGSSRQRSWKLPGRHEVAHQVLRRSHRAKDRKETIVQELLADQKSREYFKRKYNEIQDKSASGGKKWYKQMQERKKRR